MTEQRHIITDEELDEIVSLSGQYGSYFDVCRLIERVRSRPTLPADACSWSEDDEGNWHTGCGQIHQFANGTPKENHHEYCPYCGKPLREVAP